MIKILILLAIVAVTTMIGVCLANDKKRAMVVMKEFYDFNETMLMNMQFERNNVQTVAMRFGYVQKKLEGKSVLSGDKEAFLNDYIAIIGKSNSASQVEFFRNKKLELQKQCEQTKEQYEKYGSLYIKIFFMVGILIAVLFA